jgi:hypothetical protein
METNDSQPAAVTPEPGSDQEKLNARHRAIWTAWVAEQPGMTDNLRDLAVGIAVAASTAERERIRQLAIRNRARYWWPSQSLSDAGWPFSELIEDQPRERDAD